MRLWRGSSNRLRPDPRYERLAASALDRWRTEQQRRRRGRWLLKWIERGFLGVGLLALLWCVWLAYDIATVQRLGREEVEAPVVSPSALSPSGALPVPDVSPPQPETALPQPVTRGTPLAELSVPRLGLTAIVFHGSDEHTLEMGLGHIENTPLPGQPGNVAIAGHRDSFFRPLRNVKLGDEIVLEAHGQRLQYRVTSLRVVSPREVSVLAPTSRPALTLVTCYPFSFFGHAPSRFIVRAERTDAPQRASTNFPSAPPEGRSRAVARSR